MYNKLTIHCKKLPPESSFSEKKQFWAKTFYFIKFVHMHFGVSQKRVHKFLRRKYIKPPKTQEKMFVQFYQLWADLALW